MKILVENSGYHLRNLGDVAMLQAACLILSRDVPNAQLSVFTTEPARLNRSCPVARPVGCKGQAAWLSAKCYPIPFRLLPRNIRNALYQREKTFKFREPEKALTLMRNRRGFQNHEAAIMEWLAEIRAADLVIATGGGYITDAFREHWERVAQTLRWATHFSKPIALVGQGLGPLTDQRIRDMTATILRQADHVTLRESQGVAFAQDIGVDPARWIVTGDDAFANLPAAFSTADQLIGLNLRIADYAGSGGIEEGELRGALAMLQSTLETHWMPLPIDMCPDQGDLLNIKRMIPEDQISPFFSEPRTPSELAMLVARCRIVITGSYHAAVFALGQGVPVVALVANEYYRKKFDGLRQFFSDGVSVFDLSQNPDMKPLIAMATRKWNTDTDFRAHLARCASAIAQDVRNAYRRLVTGIKTEG